MGLEIAQMWDAADGKLVDMSSDTLPGLPTQEQILGLRAKGVQPTRQGGFGYLRGPDGIMIENAQAGDVERFKPHSHVPRASALRDAVVRHAPRRNASAGRGGAPGALPPGECKQPYAPPTWPSFAKFPGFVRDPSGAVFFDDISISTAVPGGGLVSTRATRRSLGAQRRELDPAVTRLKSEGVSSSKRFIPGETPCGDDRSPDGSPLSSWRLNSHERRTSPNAGAPVCRRSRDRLGAGAEGRGGGERRRHQGGAQMAADTSHDPDNTLRVIDMGTYQLGVASSLSGKAGPGAGDSRARARCGRADHAGMRSAACGRNRTERHYHDSTAETYIVTSAAGR